MASENSPHTDLTAALARALSKEDDDLDWNRGAVRVQAALAAEGIHLVDAESLAAAGFWYFEARRWRKIAVESTTLTDAALTLNENLLELTALRGRVIQSVSELPSDPPSPKLN